MEYFRSVTKKGVEYSKWYSCLFENVDRSFFDKECLSIHMSGRFCCSIDGKARRRYCDMNCVEFELCDIFVENIFHGLFGNRIIDGAYDVAVSVISDDPNSFFCFGCNKFLFDVKELYVLCDCFMCSKYRKSVVELVRDDVSRIMFFYEVGSFEAANKKRSEVGICSSDLFGYKCTVGHDVVSLCESNYFEKEHFFLLDQSCWYRTFGSSYLNPLTYGLEYKIK